MKSFNFVECLLFVLAAINAIAAACAFFTATGATPTIANIAVSLCALGSPIYICMALHLYHSREGNKRLERNWLFTFSGLVVVFCGLMATAIYLSTLTNQ